LFDSPSILENTDNPRRMTAEVINTEEKLPKVNCKDKTFPTVLCIHR
jgi:hypothetical protein